MKSAHNNAPVFALDEDTLWSDLEDAVAAVCAQMEEAEGLRFYGHEHTGPDEASFYFVRGGAAVRAFDKALRTVTRRTQG